MTGCFRPLVRTHHTRVKSRLQLFWGDMVYPRAVAQRGVERWAGGVTLPVLPLLRPGEGEPAQRDQSDEMEWVVLTVTSSTPGTFRAIFVTSTTTSLSMRSEVSILLTKTFPFLDVTLAEGNPATSAA